MTGRTAKALGALRQIAALGLPPAVIFDDMLECLKDVVPFESANIVLLNSDYSVRDALANVEMAPQVSQRYVERWFHREEKLIYPSHIRLQNDPRLRVMRVSDFTPKFGETELYDEILSHWDHHWIAGVTCRDGTRPVGNLGIGRPGQLCDFSDEDLQLLELARPYVSQALSARDSFELESESGEVEHAMVCANLEGRVLWDSPNAWRLMRWACGLPLTERMVENIVYDWARPRLADLAGRVMAALQGRPAPPATLRIINSYGEFVLRAFALTPISTEVAAGVGVQVERRLPQRLALFRSPVFRGLSGRERSVAQGLVEGASYREIAETMGVRAATVMSHVKNLYARLGVHHRQELAALLLGGGSSPMTPH